MAWEENSRICLHMQLIAILSRIGVISMRKLPSFSKKVTDFLKADKFKPPVCVLWNVVNRVVE